MKRFLLCLAFLLLPSLASATNWYFSDCASGCLNENPCNATNAGTISDPYCLDAGTWGVNATPDTLNESAMILFDGVNSGANKEAAAGDTIYLCAGVCNGSGTATYGVNITSVDTWFCANHSGVTIRNYPGEIVTISGDKNNDGTHDTGEPYNLFSNWCVDGQQTDIHFIGSDVGGVRGLRFTRSGCRMAALDSGGSSGAGGPDGWLFDHLDIGESGYKMWGQTDYYGHCTAPDYSNVACTAFKVSGVTGTFTFTYNDVHDVCGFGHRNTNNDGGRATMLFDHNTYTDMYEVNADFDNWNLTDNTKWADITWSHNTVIDTAVAIEFKGANRRTVVEDNLIMCTGVHKVIDSSGKCYGCIVVEYWDTGNRAYSSEHVIQRNVCWAANGVYGGAGITYDANCNSLDAPCVSTYPTVIQNNIIHDCDSGASAQFATSLIGISTDTQLIVQNNTVSGGKVCIWLEDTADNIVRDNIAQNCSSGYGLYVNSGTPHTLVTYNNFYRSSGNIATVEGSTVDCAGASGIGTGNKCAASSFVDSSNADHSLRDFHLAPGDTADKNAGTAGASDDIDLDSRPQGSATDIGADEILASAPALPHRVIIISRVYSNCDGTPGRVDGYSLQVGYRDPALYACRQMVCDETGRCHEEPYQCSAEPTSGYAEAYRLPDPGTGADVTATWDPPTPPLGAVTLLKVDSVRNGIIYGECP